MLAVTARATKVAVVRNLLKSGQKGRIARRQGLQSAYCFVTVPAAQFRMH